VRIGVEAGRLAGALMVVIGGALLLAGCSSGTSTPPKAVSGTVTGILEAVGGAAPGTPRPLVGTVSIHGARGTTITAKTGSDGRFSVRVAAGSYTVTGRSPLYQGGKANCTASGSITVTGGATKRVLVACQEK
jgi:hypothetical protein